jgi:hypothetical protein
VSLIHGDIDFVTLQWSEWRKTVQLTIITLAAIVPDFDSGIGQCRAEKAVLAGIEASLFVSCRNRVHLRAREAVPYHSWRDQ